MRYDTFTVELRVDASPGTVFRAFEAPEVRRRWFRLPGTITYLHHDFGVGGSETVRSTFTPMDAPPEQLEYHARYIDIAPGGRIAALKPSSPPGR